MNNKGSTECLVKEDGDISKLAQFRKKPLSQPDNSRITRSESMISLPQFIGTRYNLRQFISELEKFFPVAVKIVEGFLGKDEDDSLSVGEQLIIYYRDTMISLKGRTGSGKETTIDVDHPDKISATVLSDNSLYEQRYSYTVDELTLLKQLPKRIMALNSFRVSDILIETGDILEIKEKSKIGLNVGKRDGNKLSHFHIPRNIPVSFSCVLSLMPEPIHKILKKCQFPQRVLLHSKEQQEVLPFTITSTESNAVVLANTFIWNRDDCMEITSEMFAIEESVTIEVQIVGKAKLDKRFENTDEIYKNLDYIHTFGRSYRVERGDLGTLIKAQPHPEVKNYLDMLNEMRGIEFRSGEIYEVSPHLDSGFKLPEIRLDRQASDSSSNLSNNGTRIYQSIDDDKNQYTKVPAYYDIVTSESKNISDYKIMTEVASSPMHTRYLKKEYTSITIDEIGELLRRLNLEKYRESFMENCINGELFTCIGEDELKELGVTSALNRMKLTIVGKKMKAGENLSTFLVDIPKLSQSSTNTSLTNSPLIQIDTDV